MTNPLPLKRQKRIKLEELPDDALQEIRGKEQQSPGIMDEHIVDLARIQHAASFTQEAKKELFNKLLSAIEETPISNNKKIGKKARRATPNSNDSRSFSPAHMVTGSKANSLYEV